MPQSNSTAANWFKDEADFRRICGDAVSMASNESAQEFANKMLVTCKKFGLKTYISEKQLRFLCQLADVEAPLPIDPEQ